MKYDNLLPRYTQSQMEAEYMFGIMPIFLGFMFVCVGLVMLVQFFLHPGPTFNEQMKTYVRVYCVAKTPEQSEMAGKQLKAGLSALSIFSSPLPQETMSAAQSIVQGHSPGCAPVSPV